MSEDREATLANGRNDSRFRGLAILNVDIQATAIPLIKSPMPIDRSLQRRNGATAQRRNGATAQRRNGATAQRREPANGALYAMKDVSARELRTDQRR